QFAAGEAGLQANLVTSLREGFGQQGLSPSDLLRPWALELSEALLSPSRFFNFERPESERSEILKVATKLITDFKLVEQSDRLRLLAADRSESSQIRSTAAQAWAAISETSIAAALSGLLGTSPSPRLNAEQQQAV